MAHQQNQGVAVTAAAPFCVRLRAEANQTMLFRRTVLSVACLGLAIFLFALPCLSSDLIVGNFGAGDLSGWTPNIALVME